MSDQLANLSSLHAAMAQGNVEALEASMLEQQQVSCGVVHRFGPGIYMREVTIPADTFAIGHHQKFEQMNIMLKGRVSVVNEKGGITELVAPMTFTGQPGRKIGYIHEEVVWLNVYATDETNIDALEAHFLTKSDAWMQSDSAKKLLCNLKTSVDSLDYLKVLDEVGISEEMASSQARNESDMTSLPFGGYKIKVAASPIDGDGLFATADIYPGEVIAPARINGLRTIAGRYPNHSLQPNAVMRQNGLDIDLVAIAPISGCMGGKDGDEITVNYRESVRVTLQIANG